MLVFHRFREIIKETLILMRMATNKNLTRNRYNRIAFFYDFIEAPLEHLRFASWRPIIRDRIKGSRALEVGVGTGKNLDYYPDGIEVTAVDLSPRMLKRAQKRAGLLLLEHMRPDNELLGILFDALNPLIVRMMGANINRRTIENIKMAGWQIQTEKKLSSDIVWLIEATP